jgi:hypothetical protein
MYTRVSPGLELVLARARQEQSAARLLASRGHLAEGLRLTLRALDSAFQAAQLVSARNEPAAALRVLGVRHEARALDVLRRARTLDVPALDRHVQLAMRVLMRDAVAITHELILSIERVGASERGSLSQRLRAWFGLPRPRLPDASRDPAMARKI